jgi:hypothetical protein
MKTLLTIFFMILTVRGYCSTVVAVYPSPGEDTLVYLSNGQVLHLPPEQAPAPTEDGLALLEKEITTLPYQPTILENQQAAYAIFEAMRDDYKEEAECYNMAHIWAYEAIGKSGLLSQKMFLFFGQQYIRRYRFKWWFHVAPMVLVKQGSAIDELVLDRRYTTLPLPIREWTDQFIQSGNACRPIKTYAQYKQQEKQQDCFLLPVSMYYWQPRDILQRDRSGREKTIFIGAEIKAAYRQGFMP